MKYWFLLLLSFLLTNCKPVSQIFIQNKTGSGVTIIVSYQEWADKKVDSLRCTDKAVRNYKTLKRDSLEARIPVEKYETGKYRVVIKNNRTILLEPMIYGVPINEIIYQSGFSSDTIINAYRFKPAHDLVAKLEIERIGLYNHLIILKK